MLRIFDKETSFKYSDVVNKQIKNQEFRCLLSVGDYKKAKSRKYRELYRQIPIVERIKINIIMYCPWIVSLKNKMRNK